MFFLRHAPTPRAPRQPRTVAPVPPPPAVESLEPRALLTTADLSVGQWEWSLPKTSGNGTAKVTADVYNNSDGGTSGSLRIDLELSTRPFGESRHFYRVVAQDALPQLPAGYHRTYTASHPFNLDQVPKGTYYIVLRVAEYTGNGRYTSVVSETADQTYTISGPSTHPAPKPTPKPTPKPAPSPTPATPKPPRDSAGNAPARARNLGKLNKVFNLTDYVGAVDADDYYRVSLPKAHRFAATLTGLSANADLLLLDANGKTLAKSAKRGHADETLSKRLKKGTYFLRVSRTGRAANTTYSLRLGPSVAAVVTPTPGPSVPDPGGNDDSLSSPTPLGSPGPGDTVLTDFVGAGDPADVYRFTLPSTRTLGAVIDQLTGGDADLQLLDANGNVLITSDADGTDPDYAVQGSLPPGDYFLRVYPAAGPNAPAISYRLTLSSADPDLAGQDRASALDLNSPGVDIALAGRADAVGLLDPADFYTFHVDGSADLDLALRPTQTGTDADVELQDATGNVLASSRNLGAAPESIHQTLPTGQYFLRAYVPTGGGTLVPYTLDLTLAHVRLGATMANAKSIGTGNGTFSGDLAYTGTGHAWFAMSNFGIPVTTTITLDDPDDILSLHFLNKDGKEIAAGGPDDSFTLQNNGALKYIRIDLDARILASTIPFSFTSHNLAIPNPFGLTNLP